MISVLVTAKDSQLARCIKDLEINYPQIEFHFKNSKELDITDRVSVNENFQKKHFNYCINCAAYTAVDKAENEPDKAMQVNKIGVKNLAEVCNSYNTILIHISTDFVFDGEKTTPYLETDEPNPLNSYGRTKRDGENEIISILRQYFIIRTSWLYSEYGNNFFKTMLKLSKTRDTLKIVDDQIGSPTYAKDLAESIIRIITSTKTEFGIYHYANKGAVSWYAFAKEIFKIADRKIIVEPLSFVDYSFKTERPKYSVLSQKKIKHTFNLEIKDWKVSLKKAFKNLNKVTQNL